MGEDSSAAHKSAFHMVQVLEMADWVLAGVPGKGGVFYCWLEIKGFFQALRYLFRKRICLHSP